MSRRFASLSLAGLALAAGLGFAGFSPAAAEGGEWGWRGGPPRHGYGYGYRPAPPVFHGYWGHRQWRRQHDGYGFRAPPPRYGYGYGHGWR